MKKTICKKEYDTETSTQIQKYTYAQYGDPYGYEEILYKTPSGSYFLHVNGGENSPHPNEDIIRIAKTKVAHWQENH
jgi:hypothetical protein